MNAVLFNQNKRIVGSLLDAIEYFLCMKMHNKQNFLFLTGKDKSYKDMVISIIKDRYNKLDYRDFEDNIIVCSNIELLKMNFQKVLFLDYGSIPHLKCRFRAKEIFVITELFSDNPRYFFDKNKFNVNYFAEMPFVYSDEKYNMKFLFEFYSDFDLRDDRLYINSPNNPIETDLELQAFLKAHWPNKEILCKSLNKPKESFFELFDTYLYYHKNLYFDPHPRLFHECYFYNKKIHFENIFNVVDGASIRFDDLQKNGLKYRYLDDSDPIIKEFIK